MSDVNAVVAFYGGSDQDGGEAAGQARGLRPDDMKAGTRVGLRVPAGSGRAFGPEPFAPGQGFTIRSGSEIWRAILLAASADADGGGAELLVELADCTPVGYGA